ncbi:MAG: hypothetical protein Rsou_1055 [Candidatus Ruthia sp. Asou_11_S2]|nr:hypothetical protein [Candidatus Ruthia sp. Asou_11_S2]
MAKTLNDIELKKLIDNNIIINGDESCVRSNAYILVFMKKIALLLLLTITSVNAGWSDFLSNTGKKEQSAQEAVKEQSAQEAVKEQMAQEIARNKIPLQNQLDELLRYNGKFCTTPSSNVHVVEADYSSSSSSNKGTEYTNYQKMDNGNYYTYKSNIGGSTEYSGYYKVTIQNNGEDTVSANIDFSSTHKTCVGFLAALSNGGCRGGTSSTSWSVDVPPEKHTFDKYYDLNEDWFVSGDAKATISVGSTSDDYNYNSSNTLNAYSSYLKNSGCHYHLSSAQSKIKQLFSKQEFENATNLTTPKERISALKEYQKVFNTNEVKQAIYFNERVIYLSDKTKDYNSVYWEQGNPLLTTFKSDFNINEIADLPLVLAVDNYVKTSQNKTKTISDFVAKQLPAKPSKNDFGTKPNEQGYPIEPIFTKGEFETSKKFNTRNIKETQNWKAQKTNIDKANKIVYDNYLKQQNNTYQQALASYQKTKAHIIKDNTQAKQRHEKNQVKANRQSKNDKQKYYWQAALKAIGDKNLEFQKLDYDADKEQFDYTIKGGEIDMLWKGEIDVPIAKAKIFKQAMQSSKKRIHFKIGDTLSVVGFGIDNTDFNYAVNNVNTPVFAGDDNIKEVRKQFLKNFEVKIKLLINRGDERLVEEAVKNFNIVS